MRSYIERGIISVLWSARSFGTNRRQTHSAYYQGYSLFITNEIITKCINEIYNAKQHKKLQVFLFQISFKPLLCNSVISLPSNVLQYYIRTAIFNTSLTVSYILLSKSFSIIGVGPSGTDSFFL